MSAPDSSILIVGSGAMACLFAAYLAAAGQSVTMLGSWQEALQSLKRHGVRLVLPDGTEQAYPVQATANPDDCRHAHHALVLVKAWQTNRAAEQLSRCLPSDGMALTLQNGVGNYETLRQALGAERVALGVTTTGATLLGPGWVRPAGRGPVTLGVHPRLELLAERLRQAGFEVKQATDLDSLLWGKLVINVSINPLAALLEVPNGELLNRQPARQLMADAAQETAAVASALNICLPYDDPVAAVEAVVRNTASNRNSMLQDVLRGAPTEIDALCGAVVRAGALVGVPTPINRVLWQLIRARLPGGGNL